jgi:phenol hydroxylase P0 protein
MLHLINRILLDRSTQPQSLSRPTAGFVANLDADQSTPPGLPAKYRDFWLFTRFWQGLCIGGRAMTRATPFDPAARFVRVIATRPNGMVEFEFAVGEPELFVEMLMPQAQFDEFCAAQGVVATPGPLPGAAEGSAEHEWDWSLHAAREQRFRRET